MDEIQHEIHHKKTRNILSIKNCNMLQMIILLTSLCLGSGLTPNITREHMISNIFFEFSSKLLSSTFQASACGLKSNKEGLDEYGMLIKGDYRDIHFPVTFKQESGKKFTDILDTGWTSLYLISDRMKKILEENKLTGWRSYPIKLYDKKDNEIFGYHGFSITGQCAQINYEEAKIIEKRIVPDGPLVKYFKGIHIDLDKWDGTDFFSPIRNYGLFINKKTAEILSKNKITNLCLEDVVDIEVDVRIIKRNFV